MFDFPRQVAESVADYMSSDQKCDLDSALRIGVQLVEFVDEFISHTAPFTLAKRLDQVESGEAALGAILDSCVEALRVATLLLYPAMPEKMAEVWRNWNCDHLNDPADANSGFRAPLRELAEWGGRFSLKPGQKIEKGEALFMRAGVGDLPPEVGG